MAKRPTPPPRGKAKTPAPRKPALRGVAAGASSRGNRRSDERLAFSDPAPRRLPRRVSTRWVKFFVGIFLLPVAYVLTQTFFGAFSRATLRQEFWMTDEFWFFALGSVLWTLWFFGSIWSLGEPRPLRVYVFGHELTHAVWVWLMGGRVTEFEVSREGGSILTDTDNVWVALAPYFYPIYSLAVVISYGAASVFYDVAGSRETLLFLNPLQWLFLLLGLTWAFHLSFTCWMIPKGQSDLTSQGTFFSLVFIYVMNVVFLAGFLIVAAPEITWADFGQELLENTENFSEMVVRMVDALAHRAESF